MHDRSTYVHRSIVNVPAGRESRLMWKRTTRLPAFDFRQRTSTRRRIIILSTARFATTGERILRLAFGIRFLGRPGFSHGQVYQESGSPADKLVIRGRRVSSSVNIDRITAEKDRGWLAVIP